MAFIYKWIEGEDNLNEYCQKRFKETPHWCDTIASVGEAKVYLVYKRKADGSFAEMYLLFMPHPNGTVYNISDIFAMTYEDIRLDRTAILR